jgi:hypothetical protein
MEQRTGIAATLAIIAAIGGIILIFSGHPGWGLVVELLAIVSGIIGFFMSASPRVSGGILSITAIVIAVFGMGFSLLGIIGGVLF